MASKKAKKKSKAKGTKADAPKRAKSAAKSASSKRTKASVEAKTPTVATKGGVYPGDRFGSQAHTLAGLYRKHKIVASKDGETFTAELVEQLAAEQQAAEDKDTELYEAWQNNHVLYTPGAAKRGATFSRALDAARSLLKGDKVALETLKDAQFHTGSTKRAGGKETPPGSTSSS